MENNSANKSASKPEEKEKENSTTKTPSKKSVQLSQSGSNLEKFKSLEKNSRKHTNSKNYSISVKSQQSKNITMDRYKAELEPENEANAENDILNEIERSEKKSKKSENSSLRISEKKRSRVASRVESIKNDEEKNERFVVNKEPEPEQDPGTEKYGDDFE